MQKLQPWLLLAVMNKIWLNEERIDRKALWKETAEIVSQSLLCGTLHFVITEPFTWLSLDYISGFYCGTPQKSRQVKLIEVIKTKTESSSCAL